MLHAHDRGNVRDQDQADHPGREERAFQGFIKEDRSQADRRLHEEFQVVRIKQGRERGQQARDNDHREGHQQKHRRELPGQQKADQLDGGEVF